MIRRSPKFLVLCGGAVIACALDNRALNGVDSPCLDANQCVEAGGASGGRTNSAGATARGGASTITGGTGSSAGESAVNGDAGQVQVGPSTICPDLDHNTVLDCTETLVNTPGFDKDIKSWSPGLSGAISWESLDYFGGDASGSIRVENRGVTTGPDSGTIITAAQQCVKIQAERAYVIYAQMYARGTTVNAYGSVVGRVFASADCTGTPLRVETSAIQGTVNVWLTLQASVPAGTSAGSLLVELSVGKPVSVTGATALNFDNVLVR